MERALRDLEALEATAARAPSPSDEAWNGITFDQLFPNGEIHMPQAIIIDSSDSDEEDNRNGQTDEPVVRFIDSNNVITSLIPRRIRRQSQQN